MKGNNLDHDPRCVITLSSWGFDMVCEGEAAKVSDVEKLERVARAYADQGWPAYVHDGVLDAPYSAPWTGPAPTMCTKSLPLWSSHSAQARRMSIAPLATDFRSKSARANACTRGTRVEHVAAQELRRETVLRE